MIGEAEATKENRCTPFNEQCLITDLVAELAIVLHEKAILESKNAELKLECQELKHKFTNYEQITNEEKDSLLQKLKKLQFMMHQKEIASAEKDVKCLQEQKNYLKEINELKTVYNKQRHIFGQKELELKNEIELLKAKTSEINHTCTVQRKMADAYNNKCIKYKAKLKHAVEIIKSLTVKLEKYEQKPLKVTKEIQTDTRCKTLCEGCTSFISLHNNHHTTKNENIILTELFFKPYPSDNEIETIFFIPQESNDNFKKVTFK